MPDFADFIKKPVNAGTKVKRPIVCIQGLGFVGAAMAVAVSEARTATGEPAYNVLGVDLPTPAGEAAIRALNSGLFPHESNDQELTAATAKAHDRGNLIATSDNEAFSIADVVIVDINLDLGPPDADGEPTVRFENFLAGIQTIGEKIPADCLVLVETTVPPGTCEKLIAPKLRECFAKRGLPADGFYLAHSYERVMPGDQYLHSIVNFWRVFAGETQAAGDRCEAFLRTVVNTKDYPMTRLESTTASETAKVLENSYRAVTIAFAEEWGRFAENVGIDMYAILKAIRMRPTHNNIRQPGFGVGGYCLTKDPLFARAAAKKIFNRPDLDFEFSRRAVSLNNVMPLVTVQMLAGMFGGELAGKRILLCGVSYRPDVGDTRYSASEVFVQEIIRRGAKAILHDPLVKYWRELDTKVSQELPAPSAVDAVVFAVAHREYRSLDVPAWLNGHKPAILDANNVLTDLQIASVKTYGCRIRSIGRGEKTAV